jgi:hypothetical protein
MEDLINAIIADESPSQISDEIKNILSSKALEKIDQYKPQVAASMFDTSDE